MIFTLTVSLQEKQQIQNFKGNLKGARSELTFQISLGDSHLPRWGGQQIHTHPCMRAPLWITVGKDVTSHCLSRQLQENPDSPSPSLAPWKESQEKQHRQISHKESVSFLQSKSTFTHMRLRGARVFVLKNSSGIMFLAPQNVAFDVPLMRAKSTLSQNTDPTGLISRLHKGLKHRYGAAMQLPKKTEQFSR